MPGRRQGPAHPGAIDRWLKASLPSLAASRIVGIALLRLLWSILGLSVGLSLVAPAWACPPLSAGDAAALPLAVALQRVAACHPDVRAARAALDAAGADVRTAGQRPNPQLSVGANSISRSGFGSGNLWNKTFDHQVRVDQLLERGNKPALRTAAAQALRDAAQADWLDTQRQARAAVAHAHADLWAALARREALAAFAQLSAESLRVLDQRVRSGDAPALDATRVRLDDARVQADLRQAEADVRQQRLLLAQLIGAADVAGTLVPRVEPSDPGAAAPLPGEAGLERRADLVAALARTRAAEAARDLAQSQRTRDLGVGVQFDRYPTGPGNASGSGNTVSVGVSLPLFVNHAYEGEIGRAEADLVAAREAYERVRRAAQADLARAQAQRDAATQRRTLAATQLVPAAQQLAAGAELAYRRGGLGALDLIEARRNLRAAQLEQVNAEADWAKAAADWDAAVLPIESLAADR